MKIARFFAFLLISVYLATFVQSAWAQRVIGARIGWGVAGMLSMNRGQLTSDAPQDGYHETSMENLSRLYWALGMLDEKDDIAIEQFLFINDCDLFNRFSQDSEQWPQIKATTRDMICKKKDDFAIRFEVLIPTAIGAPDKTGSQYAITPAMPVNNLKQLDLSGNAGAEVCGSKEDIKSYPRSLLLNLAAPITVTSVPATQELKEHIEAQKNLLKNTTATLRLKIRIGKYVDTQQINGSWHAVVTAAVDGYELYNGSDLTKLLYARDLPAVSLGDRATRAKKAKAEDAAQEDAPKGGSLNDLYTADKGPEVNDYSAAEGTNPDDPCARGALPF